MGESVTNVVKLYPPTMADDADAVLEWAKGCYESLLIIGWDHNNELFVRSTKTLKHEQVLWLIEAFKQKLVSGDYSD